MGGADLARPPDTDPGPGDSGSTVRALGCLKLLARGRGGGGVTEGSTVIES